MSGPGIVIEIWCDVESGVNSRYAWRVSASHAVRLEDGREVQDAESDPVDVDRRHRYYPLKRAWAVAFAACEHVRRYRDEYGEPYHAVLMFTSPDVEVDAREQTQKPCFSLPEESAAVFHLGYI